MLPFSSIACGLHVDWAMVVVSSRGEIEAKKVIIIMIARDSDVTP